jgi:hypothetical protein
VIAEPFAEPGVKFSESCASDEPTEVIVGASGAAYGEIAEDAEDSGENPLWFFAATVHV